MKAVQSLHLLLLCSSIALSVVHSFLRIPRPQCLNTRASYSTFGRYEAKKPFTAAHSDVDPSKDSVRDNDEQPAPEYSPNFSVDIFGDIDSTDEDLLAIMREKKVLSNDAWQSRLFRDNQAGQWEGTTISALKLLVDCLKSLFLSL